jgi:hypothetical protein
MEHFLIGATGAIAFEFLKLYERMEKLEADRFQLMVTSRLYWVIVGLMAIASGFVAWGINATAQDATIWQVIISGIGARSLVSKPIEIHVARKNTDLGGDSSQTFRDMFE